MIKEILKRFFKHKMHKEYFRNIFHVSGIWISLGVFICWYKIDNFGGMGRPSLVTQPCQGVKTEHDFFGKI